MSEVRYKLKKIFKDRSGIDFGENKDSKELKLFGPQLDIDVRDVLLILYDIEELLHIEIPRQAILGGKFDSYNHIEELVIQQCGTL